MLAHPIKHNFDSKKKHLVFQVNCVKHLGLVGSKTREEAGRLKIKLNLMTTYKNTTDTITEGQLGAKQRHTENRKIWQGVDEIMVPKYWEE